jgi:beta-lactamase superfamily II metal-dependent hydrolase
MNSSDLKINVSRQQYGVGQGCFHVQELVFEDTSNLTPMLTYRFVYDCGASVFQTEKTLGWCVEHATAGSTRLGIDAVYLSHFEADHVNGLQKLCQSANVKRIYAPHITVDQAIHIIAQQLAGSVQLTTEYRTFVSTVLAVARGEDIYGVPVTLITSVGEPPEQSAGQTSDGNFDSASIQVTSPESKELSHSLLTGFSLTNVGAGSSPKIDIWELVHWCYSSNKALTDTILKEISNSVVGYSKDGKPGICANAKAAQVAQTLTWFQKNHKEISRAYTAAMKSFNREHKPEPPIPNNHNVASLCLYSGPINSNARIENYSHSGGHTKCRFVCPFCEREVGKIRCQRPCPFYERENWKNMSWIATGDAMLKIPDIWTSFEKHFGKNRIKQCSTVLIPHHGADAKTSQNFNADLIRQGQNCVISAGAKNPYHHPHRNVVSAILDVSANVQLVTETNPQGFLERLEVRFH